MLDGNISRRRALQSGSVVGAGILAGCIGGSDDDGGVIKIGSIEPRSGPYAQFADLIDWGSEAALDKINEDGGINGNEVKIVHRDSEIDPSVATEKANQLISNENIDLLGHPVSSSVVLALMPLAERNNIVFHSGLAGSQAITGEDCNNVTFRVKPSPLINLNALVPYLRNQGFETASIIYPDYSYGQMLTEEFTKLFEAEGGEVINTVDVELGTSDYAPAIQRIDRSADILFSALGGGDIHNFFPDAVNAGIKDDMQIVGKADEVDTATFGDGETGAISDLLDGLISFTPYPQMLTGIMDTEENRQFHEEYKEISGGELPDRGALFVYEMMMAWKKAGDAIGYNGKEDNDALIDELRGIEMKRSLEFPQGDKYFREEDNQAMSGVYIVTIDGTEMVIEDFLGPERAEQTEVRCER